MAHAATIFLSSFLLFLVQPLIARLILPWFGGTAAVWTTCMLFFQVLLLAGYAYAHWLNERKSVNAQAALHLVLLFLAILVLPIAPPESLKPTGAEEPISRILLVLGASVGLPYFLLASTSPLVQAWFARARPGADPYRLFALSNLASLAALVGYPFAVEPWLTSRQQVTWWSWLFAAFAVLCAGLAFSSRSEFKTESHVRTGKPTQATYLLWLSLSAAGSVLLLAVTNHVSQNVAAIPLLWLAPLTLYLLTFIVAFSGDMRGRGWYRPTWYWVPLLAALGAMGWLLVDDNYQFELFLQLGVYFAGLFVACFFCHGELYRSRPAADHLTAFYLTVAAGGALGGLLVAVLAPILFKAYWELGIGLVAVALLAAVRYARVHPVARYATLLGLLGVAVCAGYDATRFEKNVHASARSFYGVLRVKEYGEPGTPEQERRLVHGVIMHGEQYLNGPRRRVPGTYYQYTSGVGAALLAKKDGPPIRVGVIGLGTGTLAAYGRAKDLYRFYDINPQVVRFARSEFTYLADSEASVQIALGDARLSLEREPPQRFDLLAVDAFSSDSIPVHLITREALAVYLRHLKPSGIVAFHVSNRFLRLVPVVAALAKDAGLHAVAVYEAGGDDDEDRTQSDWVLLSRDPKALQGPEFEKVGAEAPEERPDWRLWTDDYSNLVQILK